MVEDEIKSILTFLSIRMSIEDKKGLFAKLGVSSVSDILKADNRADILEALRIEKRKRTKVLDIKFELPKEAKKYVKPSSSIRAYGSHVDKCIGDDD